MIKQIKTLCVILPLAILILIIAVLPRLTSKQEVIDKGESPTGPIQIIPANETTPESMTLPHENTSGLDLSQNVLSKDKSLYYKIQADATEEYVIIVGPGMEIENLDIPSTLDGYTVKEIAERAFWEADCLRTVRYPITVTQIGASAFEGCTNLETVSGYGNVHMGERVFARCPTLKEAPMNTILPSYAFFESGIDAGALNLENVKVIGDYAFAYTKTSSLTLTPNTYSIGEGAFYGCSDLTMASIPWYVQSVGEKAFAQCNEGLYFLAEKDSTICDYAKTEGIAVIYKTRY